MRITANGVTKAEVRMREMAARVSDLRPAMEEGAQAFLKFVSDRFRSATDPEGNPWAPLAASTVKRRRIGNAAGGNPRARILQDTGALKNSITAVAGPRSITFGTAVPYAGPHQFGTARIPRRAFLPVVASGGGYTFTKAGPAAALVERIRKAIIRHVLGRR